MVSRVKNGLVRYRYCVGGKIFGYYVCDVVDFRKFWKSIGRNVDWCIVDIGIKGLEWSVSDGWIFDREWKKKGWYQRGWKFYKGV